MRRITLTACISASFLLLTSWLYAQQLTHIRFVEGEGSWEGQLQTAITQFRNADGQQVFLISAVHIGDSEYYARLNKEFSNLDALLFELVTDEENFQLAQTSSQAGSPLSFIQSMLGNYLDLEFQLTGIDYSASNFRHADLSASDLAEIMATKDESFFSMFIAMAAAQIAAEQEGIANDSIKPSAFTLVALIDALSADNQAQALKYLIAEELARSGGLALSAEAESGLTILGDRNAVALDVLQTTLEEGAQDIGLFYGAAHMTGLTRELTDEMGFRFESQRWLTAWAIP